MYLTQVKPAYLCAVIDDFLEGAQKPAMERSKANAHVRFNPNIQISHNI